MSFVSGRRRSVCLIASGVGALTLIACSSADIGSSGGSGGVGAIGGGGSAGLGNPGQAGTFGAAGTGSGVGASGSGTTGAGGTGGTGGTGGGAMSGSSGRGGSSGNVGASGGRSGGTAGSKSGGAAGSPIGGAAGSPTGGTAGSAGDGGGSGPVMPGSGCTAPTAYTNLFVTVSGHTQADSDTKVAAAWSALFNPSGSGTIYHNGPGTGESYVEDTYNNDVRTEGMSYGMMIALQLDHQAEFDSMWTFVKNHMAQGTGQIAWHVSTSGSKLATGGAPDGDEYFAAALVFAHNRWGDTSGKYTYATEAQWVLDLIRTQDFSKSSNIVQFYSGSGNTDGSYVLPAFYQTWACFDTANAAFWNTAVTAGRNFFHAAIDSNGVIGDQSSFTGQTVKGAGADTIRCVANIMMDHNFFNADSWQTDTYAPKYGAYETSHASGVAQQSCNALLGFGLPASTGKPFVDKLWSTTIPNRDYWNGVLYMLGMLHVSGTFQLWY
jgi:oligosaccharide reducing-end xylanase